MHGSPAILLHDNFEWVTLFQKLKFNVMETFTFFKKKQIRIMIGILLLFFGLQNPKMMYGQDWPVSFEGAPSLKPAQLEISLYGAGSYLSSTFVKGTIGYLPGLKIGIGIVNHFDVKLSYSRGFYKFSSEDKLEDSKVNNICIMPKASILNGHLAFQLPFTLMATSVTTNGDKKTELYYLLSPRIIGSLHYKQFVECNLSPFFEVFIPGHGEDPYCFIGGNLGFAFSSNLKRWSVRPEGFISYYFPKSGEVNYKIIYSGWGLAFTYNIDFIKNKPETPE